MSAEVRDALATFGAALDCVREKLQAAAIENELTGRLPVAPISETPPFETAKPDLQTLLGMATRLG